MDFDAFEILSAPVTGIPYIKMQFGPVPRKADYDGVIKKMVDQDELKIFSHQFYDKVQKRYVALVEPDLARFSADEINLVDKVINRMSDMTATEISNYVHADAPWKATASMEIIDYGLVHDREEPHAQRDSFSIWESASAGDILSQLGPMSDEEAEYYQKLGSKLPSFIPGNQNKTGPKGAEFSRDKKTTHKSSPKVKKVHKRSVKVKGLDDWLSKLPTQDWFDFASQQRARLAKEVNHLSTEILNRISESNILSNRDDILKEAKQHLESIMSHINGSELVSRVIDAARGTRNEILSFLNIPSSKELTTLQKRLHQLEKKMNGGKARPRARA
jgi:hypothetical protein